KSRFYATTPRAMPVLGSPESVGAITRDAVLAHYRKNYRPERMVLFLAGAFDRAAVLPLLEKTFGAGAASAPAGARPAARPATGAPPRVRGATRPGFYRQHMDGERGHLH